MNRPAWSALVGSLDLCPATRNFAGSLQLTRVDGNILHLASAETATRSAVEKLASAISDRTGQPVCLLLTHGKLRASLRCYRDNSEKAQ